MEGYSGSGMAAPNLVNVCIDCRRDAGSCGRLYTRFEENAQIFENEYQLLKLMEELMDGIGYPQSSVEMRSYRQGVGVSVRRKAPAVPAERMAGWKGTCATLLVYVQYRQNATWQGEVFWIEKKRLQTFRSALELLKLLDSAR